jgi:hypothetical protein
LLSRFCAFHGGRPLQGAGFKLTRLISLGLDRLGLISDLKSDGTIPKLVLGLHFGSFLGRYGSLLGICRSLLRFLGSLLGICSSLLCLDHDLAALDSSVYNTCNQPEIFKKRVCFLV